MSKNDICKMNENLSAALDQVSFSPVSRFVCQLAPQEVEDVLRKYVADRDHLAPDRLTVEFNENGSAVVVEQSDTYYMGNAKVEWEGAQVEFDNVRITPRETWYDRAEAG
jgi:hypothetical protein